MNRSLTLALAAAALGVAVPASADLIIHENFAYPVGTTGGDPDGGLNGGNGLPATNPGGSPSGTSTGLRGTWGAMHGIQDGLGYSQAAGTKVLDTSAGSSLVTNGTWGSDMFVYRNMTSDPFAAYRTPGSSEFGADGKTLYASMVLQLGPGWRTGVGAQVKFGGVSNTNIFFGVNPNSGQGGDRYGLSVVGTGFAGAGSSTRVAAAGETVLLVLRFNFGAANADSVDFWVDPELGGSLGAPMASVALADIPAAAGYTGGLGIVNFNTRPTAANALHFDELRVGTTYAAVTPYEVVPEPATLIALGAGLVGLARRRRAR